MGERRIRVADASRGADLGPAGRPVGAHATRVAARRGSYRGSGRPSAQRRQHPGRRWPAVLGLSLLVSWIHYVYVQRGKRLHSVGRPYAKIIYPAHDMQSVTARPPLS